MAFNFNLATGPIFGVHYIYLYYYAADLDKTIGYIFVFLGWPELTGRVIMNQDGFDRIFLNRHSKDIYGFNDC